MNSNPKKQNRKTLRLKEYDYSFPGWYYITVCTKDFIPWFGKVKNGKVDYNELGNIAVKYFKEITKHFKNTEIDENIIMPNHAHGIIIINDTVGTRDRVSLRSYWEGCLNQKDALSREKYLKTAWGKRFIKNRLKNYLTG